MDEIAILEGLRQKLKDDVDTFIDNAINQIKKKRESEIFVPTDRLTDPSVELSQKQIESLDGVSEDSGSLVLDCSPYPIQSLAQKNSSQLTEQTDSIKEESTSFPIIKQLSHSSKSVLSKDSLISPVLNQSMRRGVRREEPSIPVNVTDLTDRLFSRNLVCTTPIKPKSKKIRQTKPVQPNSTPPHFWSLDMPSSPDL